MWKKVLMACLCAGFIHYANAQQEQPLEVLSTAGGSHTSAGISLDWTLGESNIETIYEQDMMITQGFHQPMLRVERLTSPIVNDRLLIEVYPNPVETILELKVQPYEDVHELQLLLTDTNGRKLLTQKVSTINKSHQIDLSQFPAGAYLLHCSTLNNEDVNTFKISKIQ